MLYNNSKEPGNEIEMDKSQLGMLLLYAQRIFNAIYPCDIKTMIRIVWTYYKSDRKNICLLLSFPPSICLTRPSNGPHLNLVENRSLYIEYKSD